MDGANDNSVSLLTLTACLASNAALITLESILSAGSGLHETLGKEKAERHSNKRFQTLLPDSKGLCVGVTVSQNNAEIAFFILPREIIS